MFRIYRKRYVKELEIAKEANELAILCLKNDLREQSDLQIEYQEERKRAQLQERELRREIRSLSAVHDRAYEKLSEAYSEIEELRKKLKEQE